MSDTGVAVVWGCGSYTRNTAMTTRLKKNGQPVHRLKSACLKSQVIVFAWCIAQALALGNCKQQAAQQDSLLQRMMQTVCAPRQVTDTTYMCNTIAITESVRFQVHSRALNIIDVWLPCLCIHVKCTHIYTVTHIKHRR